MLKNKIIKRILKKIFSPFLSFINKIIMKKNIILIYSNSNGLRDNNYFIYKELLQEKIEEKNKIYIAVEKKFIENRKTKNIKYITLCKSISIFLKAKYVFYCFGQLPINPSKEQTVVHLTHGLPFKKDGLLIEANQSIGKIDYFTFVLTSSEFNKPYIAQNFGCNTDKVILGAFPRLDEFDFSIKEENIILWTPTFRSSTYLGMNDSDYNALLPIFGNNIALANELLKKYNVKVIVKLHPLQDLKNYKNYIYENIEIYSNDDFIKKYGDLYYFMNKTSALISDYSSIFLDYLILNRPIALTIDDAEAYNKNRGLLFENDARFENAVYKIKDINDFELFLKRYRADEKRSERNLLNQLINPNFEEKKNTKNLLKKLNII